MIAFSSHPYPLGLPYLCPRIHSSLPSVLPWLLSLCSLSFVFLSGLGWERKDTTLHLDEPTLAFHFGLPPRPSGGATAFALQELVPQRFPLDKEAFDERSDDARREGEPARAGERLDVHEGCGRGSDEL